MRENRFYIDQAIKTGETIELERSVAVHISKVLRMQSGDTIMLFNGDGSDYQCDLIVENKAVSTLVRSQHDNETRSPLTTHLGQGLCRSDRMDYSIQKAVEMGVSEITPLITERVQFRMDAKRSAKKMRHWQGVIIAACEQSGRADIPVLHDIMPLQDWLGASDAPLLVLDPTSGRRLASLDDSLTQRELNQLRLVVGPEGGLSTDEIGLCKEYGHAISLGPRILRTETAGTAVLAVLQHLYGDL